MPTIIALGRQFVGDVCYAPVWWYTIGARRAWDRFRERVSEGNQYLGWSVWTSNLFTPMYHQTDLSGRAISFLVRLVEVAGRSLAMAAWLAGSVALLLLYLGVPLLALCEIVSLAVGLPVVSFTGL